MSIYSGIADKLRQDILDGIYHTGQRLPTEQRLSEQFGVNRHTLRQAIALLKSEGLVRVEQGRGTFVSEAPIQYAIGQRVRYSETLRAQGRSAQSQFLSMVETPATDIVALSLKISPGAPVAMVERLSFADQEPICISSGYFPLKRFPNFLDEQNQVLLQQIGSLSRFLKQVYDCDHIRLQTSVSAFTVTLQDAQLLELKPHQPILHVESINVDHNTVPIEYGVTRFRGDRTELIFKNN